MKELMLRLIKDDKIIQRRWEVQLKDVGDALDAETKDQLDLWGYEPTDMLILYEVRPNVWSFRATDTWDSVELGIKVDESWWFEGDIINVNDNNITIPTLVYDKDKFAWTVECKEWNERGIEYTLEHVMGGYHKRIGNIHEEEK